MQQQSITLTDAIELFELDMRARRLRPGTLQFYRDHLPQFAAWCEPQGVTTLHQLSNRHIKQYLAECDAQRQAPHFIHGHARAVRAWLKFCTRDELIDTNPFDKVRMPRLPKKILPALSEDEVRTILDACVSDRDTAMLLVFLDSGVRAQELCNLDVGDVDMRTGTVSVRQGKGAKDRSTYVGARTRKALLRYLATRGDRGKPTRPLFTSVRDDSRLTYSGVAQVLQRLRTKTGITSLSPHALRRTFAITCLRNGMNIYVLARLMGHADIIVLRQYLQLVDDDSASAHAASGPIDNL